MSHLPLPIPGGGRPCGGTVDPFAVAVVLSAILAYGLSMLCWLLALRDVPLGRTPTHC